MILVLSVLVLFGLGAVPMMIAYDSLRFVAFGLLGLPCMVALWLLGRLGLVLPVRALGEPASFEQAWTWTRGRSIRVVLAMFLPLLLVGFLLEPVDWLLTQGPETLAFRWLPSALRSLVIGVITAVTLSCTYRRLRPD